jgi:hypothetical protein
MHCEEGFHCIEMFDRIRSIAEDLQVLLLLRSELDTAYLFELVLCSMEGNAFEVARLIGRPSSSGLKHELPVVLPETFLEDKLLAPTQMDQGIFQMPLPAFIIRGAGGRSRCEMLQ